MEDKIQLNLGWLYINLTSYTNKQCYSGNTEKCMIIFNRDYLDKNFSEIEILAEFLLETCI